MRKAAATLFGKTRMYELITYTDGKLDSTPAEDWVIGADVWVRKCVGDEDYYSLSNRRDNFPGLPIRLIKYDDWLLEELVSEEKNWRPRNTFVTVYRYKGEIIIPKYEGMYYKKREIK